MGKNRSPGVMMALVAWAVLLAAAVFLQHCQGRELARKDSKSEEEDLSFLDEVEKELAVAEFIHLLQEGEESIAVHEDIREFDEGDVVVLGSGNFSEFVKSKIYVLVNFYAPWCGHCRGFAPEYAKAATILKGSAVLAKVDATVNDKLADEYGVESYPSLFLFIDGVPRRYPGQQNLDDVVAWMKRKIRPAVYNLHSKEVAETILVFQEVTMAISLLDSLEGPEVEEYALASRQVDDVLFFQTKSADAADVFNFTRDVKRPALMLLKQEVDKVSWFDGEFKRDVIEEFVTNYKLPLVTTFNKKNAGLIFDSHIKKQVILFASHNDYERLISDFTEAAKALVGKFVFVHIDLEDVEQAPEIAEFFGISGRKPVVMGYDPDNFRKFSLEDEITTENVKTFGENVLSNKLKPRLKSDPIPETNDGDVKLVVGLNFDAIVLDETRDVFLEIHVPWCGHCQDLQPTWEKLGSILKGVESIVIAKMDATTNEHERAKVDGFPTLLLFPAGKNSSDPIAFESERTVKEFAKFLKHEAAIPFRITRNPTTKDESDAAHSADSSFVSLSSEPDHVDAILEDLFDHLWKDEL